MSMEEEGLYIILRKPEVFVYKIPPREVEGHRAERWTESIWKGRLQVIGQGETCIIKLLELSSDSLFAACIVSKEIERAVERTVDSSRYFVLRLDDGKGRHAFVGIGFVDRNDAFDFICAINDYYQTRIPLEPPLATSNDTRKYALAEGEHVQINLKGIQTKPRRRTSTTPAVNEDDDDTAAPTGLPPPPFISSIRRQRLKQKTENNQAPSRTVDRIRSPQITPSSRTPKEKEINTKHKVAKVGGSHDTSAFDEAFGPIEGKSFTNDYRNTISHNEVQAEQSAFGHNTTKNKDQETWDVFADGAINEWSSTSNITEANPISNNPFGSEVDDPPELSSSIQHGSSTVDLFNEALFFSTEK